MPLLHLSNQWFTLMPERIFNSFESYLRTCGLFSDEEIAVVRSQAVPRQLKKKQYLLQQGGVCKHHTFVCSGCIRSYRIDEYGSEHIIALSPAGHWAVDRMSVATGTPSNEFMDALEDSNMTIAEGNQFCQKLRDHLQPGDQCIIGFDLIKHPAVIKRAYDDREGLTKAFNLNLLTRINRELYADFRTDQFDHYCSYDPLTGAAQSYLVSLSDTTVNISGTAISFEKNECIWMEISQKYSQVQIRQMAIDNGFVHTTQFLDSRSWFMDAVWTAV